jgi:hypothetical protein
VQRENPVLILAGVPGSGKTTVAGLLAAKSPRAVHLESDRFFQVIQAGDIEPRRREAQEQNTTVMRIVAQAAAGYADAGYFTIVDGIVIPGWFFELLREWLRRRPQGRVRGAAGAARRMPDESRKSYVGPTLECCCHREPVARLRRSRAVGEARDRQHVATGHLHGRGRRRRAGREAAQRVGRERPSRPRRDPRGDRGPLKAPPRRRVA